MEEIWINHCYPPLMTRTPGDGWDIVPPLQDVAREKTRRGVMISIVLTGLKTRIGLMISIVLTGLTRKTSPQFHCWELFSTAHGRLERGSMEQTFIFNKLA